MCNNRNTSLISDYERGIRSAVLFISEMLGISHEVYKGFEQADDPSLSGWLYLARLCGMIEVKGGKSDRET